MDGQQEATYERIAKAIEYIQANFKTQPSLEQIAESVHLSPFHFQRLFTQWAGVSPKKFIQYLSLNYAKQLLQEPEINLFTAAQESGLSGTGRLHDLFVNIERMTPGDYKNGGENLHINYSFNESLFGKILIASTPKGICSITFSETENTDILKSTYPNAHLIENQDHLHLEALTLFKNSTDQLPEIKLHLKGSPFQLKVWEALLKIPQGKVSTYGAIAKEIENPQASRAVGTAIGQNPIAFLIPCHRVIQASGKIGGYMWGSTRKSAILGWEAAQHENQLQKDF